MVSGAPVTVGALVVVGEPFGVVVGVVFGLAATVVVTLLGRVVVVGASVLVGAPGSGSVTGVLDSTGGANPGAVVVTGSGRTAR